jgi:tocopherol O-methyltransferase
MLRVAKPGGKVVVVTWCHRNLLSGEASLRPDEQAVLDRINEAYYLPQWCSQNDYKKIFGVHLANILTCSNAARGCFG